MIGKKFNKWTVIGKANPYPWRTKNYTRWHCRCDCGNTHVIRENALKLGTSKSCKNCPGLIHGHSKNREQTGIYRSWRDMLTRCNNSKFKQYSNYGGRGIMVCERWVNFKSFLEDMGPTWSQGLTIDRIDNNGNYELSNCRWITRKEQFKTRGPRRTKLSKETILEIKEMKKSNEFSPDEVAYEFGISRSYVYDIVNGKLDYILNG